MAAPMVWKARREPGAQFLLAWLVPSWIVFEIVMTKLPHYVLPLYPAIAILIACAIDRTAKGFARVFARQRQQHFAVFARIHIGFVTARCTSDNINFRFYNPKWM